MGLAGLQNGLDVGVGSAVPMNMTCVDRQYRQAFAGANYSPRLPVNLKFAAHDHVSFGQAATPATVSRSYSPPMLALKFGKKGDKSFVMS